jgi:hypothetical protein
MASHDKVYEEMIAVQQARKQGFRGDALRAVVSNPASRQALCLKARIDSEGAAETLAPDCVDMKLRAANDNE